MSDIVPQETPPALERLVWWLDEAVPIPGTSLTVGLDAVVGLVLPGAGDLVTGGAGLSLVVAAMRNGVPAKVVARMVGNLAIDALVGAVPILGDLFDLAFRANRRNLDLLQAHRQQVPAPLSGPEKMTLALLGGVAIVAVSLPVLAVWGLWVLVRSAFG